MTIYLIDGKTYRECGCARQSATCAQGRERRLATTDYSRCVIPAPDAVITQIEDLNETIRKLKGDLHAERATNKFLQEHSTQLTRQLQEAMRHGYEP